jgi:hypothetical protein
MKVTEPGLNKLIDNLNTLICDDSLSRARSVKRWYWPSPSALWRASA